MCEVLNPDGTPHESNGRALIDDDDDDFWFGFEQEYTLIDLETNLPWLPQRWISCSAGTLLHFRGCKKYQRP